MAQKPQAATPNQSKPRTVNAVATRTGYYGLRRIKEGQKVTIQLAAGQELPTWAVPAGGARPREDEASEPVEQYADQQVSI